MKRSFVLAAFSILCLICNSQTLKFIIFSGGSDLSSLAYMTNQRVIIKISPDGKVQEWGDEQEAGRFYSEPGKLQPYMGRIEYFEKQFDSILNGKIRSIGVTSITYYGSTENAALVGKVKSVGNIFFNYYLDLENESLRGKIKTAGQKNLSYYTSFDNEAYRGKIKSIGGTQVSYYSTFDDVSIRGKLKSLGSYNFAWYTSLDRQGYQGGLKSGPRYPVIEGATYIIW